MEILRKGYFLNFTKRVGYHCFVPKESKCNSKQVEIPIDFNTFT